MSTILIDKLLETVVVRGASDLHLAVGQPPVLRLHGRLVRLETKSLEPADTVSLMKSITPQRCQQELQERGGTDFGFAFGTKARFRVSVFKQKGNTGLVLRQIPTELLSMDQLGTPPVMHDLILRPRGLILVTGPTGSGKSTTLAACIDYLNTNVDHHIITIEDPIEFYHYHKKSTVNQREVGIDVMSFADAIRGALRQDPDVILVGEMRDLETIEAAITAAETGHVVFGTLHTTGAQGTVNRIIDVFPTNQQDQIRTQLSTSILGILSQQLLPRIQGGRVAAYEMLVVTPAIANLIRENKTFRINSSIQTGHKLGMQLLDDHLFQLWRDGIVTKEDVLVKANFPDALDQKIRRFEAGLETDGGEEEEEEEENNGRKKK
ncbi:MAG: type IV pilus twitching motility protein PilT [Thermoguttaceae bacterium]|jgi:twitching motility protein PilT